MTGIGKMVVTGGLVFVAGLGLLHGIDPLSSTPEERHGQSVEQLDDNQRQIEEKRRRDGTDLGDTTYRDTLRSHEERPPERRPRLRIRIAP